MRNYLFSAISCSSLQNVKVEGSTLYICHSIPVLTIPAMSVYLRPRQINLSKTRQPDFLLNDVNKCLMYAVKQITFNSQ